MESPGIGLRLFGYNLSDVNEELRRVDREFYETLCDLEIKTCKYVDENQKLREEIRTLKRNRGNSALQPEFLEAAVKNAGRFIELYQGYISEEAERLREKEQRITQLYNEKLAVIDLEIKSTQKIIGMALESILNKASEISIEDLAEDDSTELKAPDIAQIADVKVIAACEPYCDSSSGTEEPPSQHMLQFEADKAKEIATISAVEDAIKAAIDADAPLAVPRPQTPPTATLRGVSWGPIPKIEFISPLTLEDFKEDQSAQAPVPKSSEFSVPTAAPTTSVAASPADPTPTSTSASTATTTAPTVSVLGLRSFKLNLPPLQVEAEKSASE